MRTRQIGDRAVSAIGFGAAGLSVADPPPEDDAVAVAVAALEAGLTLFDTATCYVPRHDAPGHNEALLARALAVWGGDRDRVVVATKAGIERIASGGTIESDFRTLCRPDDIRRQCETSLRALGTEAIDLLQLHTPDSDVPLAETMGAFRDLRAEGKVRLVGLSNVSVEQVREAREVVDVASVQNELSPGKRDHIDVLAYCQAEGLAFLAYSPLGGLGERARALAAKNQAFGEVAAERGVSPHRVALAWLLSLSPAMIPVVGARRSATILDSAAAADLDLTDADLQRLNASATA